MLIKKLPGTQVRRPFNTQEDGSLIFNLSQKDYYYSQRNNKHHPGSSCNTTSLVNSLVASDIPVKIKDGEQPEDTLSILLQSELAYKTAKKITPWFIDKKTGLLVTSPRFIAVMLCWAVHEYLGEKQAVFSAHTTLQEIVFNLVVERGCAVGLGKYTRAGHYVSFVGFRTRQADVAKIKQPTDVDATAITHLIQDDPWGDYRDYNNHNGNDIEMSVPDYKRIVSGTPDYKNIIFVRKRVFKEKQNDNYIVGAYPL